MNLPCTLSLLLALSASGAAAQAVSSRCKEPAATDDRLAAGLRLYEQGDWRGSLDPLTRWAKGPDAASDAAAGRGYYALAYALRMSGRPLEAAPWSAEARTVLTPHYEQSLSLEGFYYLASIADSRQARDEAKLVAKHALHDDGACPSPDGDDLFRLARLNAYAGNDDEATRLMTLAVEAFAAGRGHVKAYEPLAHASLAADLVASKKYAEALVHLRAAAELDPSMPRIHRAVGLTMLRLGDVAGAASYWREHATPEVDGDDIGDAGLLLDRIVATRAADGAPPAAAGLSGLDRAALDQRAREACAAWLDLSRKAGRSSGSGDAAADAERAVLDVLLEYVERGENVARVAQDNGVTKVLHGEQARTPRSRKHPGR
jgi:tetratricopeptide (TPR) repeat protein